MPLVFLLTIFVPILTGDAIPAGESTRAGKLSFENFPAVGHFEGKPSEPRLVTPHERKYRTTIREQAHYGPNFAGQYTLAKWGCGSPCLQFVIVDANSGSVFDPQFTVGCADKNGMEAFVDFRLRSRLVTTTGFSKGAGCGTDYWEWDGKRLSHLAFRPWSNPH